MGPVNNLAMPEIHLKYLYFISTLNILLISDPSSAFIVKFIASQNTFCSSLTLNFTAFN